MVLLRFLLWLVLTVYVYCAVPPDGHGVPRPTLPTAPVVDIIPGMNYQIQFGLDAPLQIGARQHRGGRQSGPEPEVAQPNTNARARGKQGPEIYRTEYYNEEHNSSDNVEEDLISSISLYDRLDKSRHLGTLTLTLEDPERRGYPTLLEARIQLTDCPDINSFVPTERLGYLIAKTRNNIILKTWSGHAITIFKFLEGGSACEDRWARHFGTVIVNFKGTALFETLSYASHDAMCPDDFPTILENACCNGVSGGCIDQESPSVSNIYSNAVRLECIDQRNDPFGLHFRGDIATTEGGPCENWTHFQKDMDSPYTMGIGDHAYCRNPDSDHQGPWCMAFRPLHDDELGIPVMTGPSKSYCKVPLCNPRSNDLHELPLFHPTMSSRYLPGWFGPELAIDGDLETYCMTGVFDENDPVYTESGYDATFSAWFSDSKEIGYFVTKVTVTIHNNVLGVLYYGSGEIGVDMHGVAGTFSCGDPITVDIAVGVYTWYCNGAGEHVSVTKKGTNTCAVLNISEVKVEALGPGEKRHELFDGVSSDAFEMLVDLEDMQIQTLKVHIDEHSIEY